MTKAKTVKKPKKPAAKAPSAGAVAAYTMYGFDWLRDDVRAFWGALAGRLKDAGLAGVPARLSWKHSEEQQWKAPGLMLGQTCGFPLMKGLTGPVRLVATPSYQVPFVEGAMYRSLIIVGKDSEVSSLSHLMGKVAAVNKPSSHSGYNAFRRLVADYARQNMSDAFDAPDRAGGPRYFAKVALTGSHLGSLQAVAAGKADVAAIDAVSFHLISRHMPELTGRVRILTTTLPAPGLPFITAASRTDAELRTLRTALGDTIGDQKLRRVMENLGFNGFQVLGRDAYGRVLEFERDAENMGYPVLA